MKSIQFTDQQIDLLAMHYLEELAEAEGYVQTVKDILEKITTEPKKERALLTEKTAIKRGRKTQKLEPMPVAEVKPKATEAKADSVKPRKSSKKEVIGQIIGALESATPLRQDKKPRTPKPAPMAEEAISIVSQADETPVKHSLTEAKKVTKKQSRKKKSYRRGITLAPLSKPLPWRDIPIGGVE